DGVRGRRAIGWRLVDEIVPPSAWEAKVCERALALAATSDRPSDARGIALPPLDRRVTDDAITYRNVRVGLDRARRRATITVLGPSLVPADLAAVHGEGAASWPLAMARDLDDA